MVDLEYAIGEILKFSDRAPVEFVEDPEDPHAEYVIVNTCGFLSSARQESEETLAYYDSLGKRLILMGCYVSVKDDAFLAGLRNLHSIVPFMSYSVIEELVLGKEVEAESLRHRESETGAQGIKRENSLELPRIDRGSWKREKGICLERR
jgi:tRNA A37 methylthiotransferase MiaB